MDSLIEADQRLGYLLDLIERGESVVITRGGAPAARLVPVARHDVAQAKAAVAGLRELRRGESLGGLSWRDLRDEGRR